MKISKLQMKTTFTWAFSLLILVFTFQMKSFHAIIFKPNKTSWPNLLSLPQSAQLQYLFTLAIQTICLMFPPIVSVKTARTKYRYQNDKEKINKFIIFFLIKGRQKLENIIREKFINGKEFNFLTYLQGNIIFKGREEVCFFQRKCIPPGNL